MEPDTITLDKPYFETLLRRAQFHAPGPDFTTPINVPTVTIPKTDHDSLLTTVRQYANLRRNLYRGGIADDTLAILIKDDVPSTENFTTSTTVHSTADATSDGGAFLSQIPTFTPVGRGGKDYTFGRNSNYTPRNSDYRPRDTNGFQNLSSSHDEHASLPDISDAFYDEDSGHHDLQPKSNRQQYDKFCKRSVLLANLPEGATYEEVVNAVRGGMLLDIYLRTKDRAASVSFLEESAAQNFFRHVKRHDLYIRGKRVEVRWNERQFILPGHVANKITIGATRNLVLLNRTAKHTEEAIRDDLEHIHNLMIIKIVFSGQNAYISTNSVHNAMFARTCMMSRSVYKGSKIEWDSDECAAPLEKPQPPLHASVSQKKKAALPVNRFHLLNMDGTENGSEEDDELDTSGITFPTAFSASTPAIVV